MFETSEHKLSNCVKHVQHVSWPSCVSQYLKTNWSRRRGRRRRTMRRRRTEEGGGTRKMAPTRTKTSTICGPSFLLSLHDLGNSPGHWDIPLDLGISPSLDEFPQMLMNSHRNYISSGQLTGAWGIPRSWNIPGLVGNFPNPGRLPRSTDCLCVCFDVCLFVFLSNRWSMRRTQLNLCVCVYIKTQTVRHRCCNMWGNCCCVS